MKLLPSKSRRHCTGKYKQVSANLKLSQANPLNGQPTKLMQPSMGPKSTHNSKQTQEKLFQLEMRIHLLEANELGVTLGKLSSQCLRSMSCTRSMRLVVTKSAKTADFREASTCLMTLMLLCLPTFTHDKIYIIGLELYISVLYAT